jgi:hypothetical protein
MATSGLTAGATAETVGSDWLGVFKKVMLPLVVVHSPLARLDTHFCIT